MTRRYLQCSDFDSNVFGVTPSGDVTLKQFPATTLSANRTTGTCAGNVGTNFAVNAIGLEFDGSGNLRTYCDSKPEHDANTVYAGGNGGSLIPSGANYVTATVTGTWTNNSCRTAYVLVDLEVNALVDFTNVNNLPIVLQAFYNGGVYFTGPSNVKHLTGSRELVNLRATQSLTYETVAPGATLTRTLSGIVYPQSQTINSATYNVGLKFYAFTRGVGL